MPREGSGEEEVKQERQVEAEVLKNTSVAGMMLHRGSHHMLPFSLAKSLRDQGLVRPVKQAIPSHPVPPPPPEDQFDGEGEVEDEKAEEQPAKEAPKSTSRK